MLALSETVGSSSSHPVRSADCAADWMEAITRGLLASSTTHCLMDMSRGEPGCRLSDSGGIRSVMATWS